MQVEIYSDVVCPWCYIGKRRLEAALGRFGGDVEVIWRPYQLDPHAPLEATPVLDAYARKFGGAARAAAIVGRVTDLAAAEGLEFRLEEAWRANTFDAHRLLRAALDQGGAALQGALAERLFRAYFTEGLDVSRAEVLERLGDEVGVPVDVRRGVLDGDQATLDVRAELDGALDRGVTAVPTFLFAGVWAVPGAQEPDTFLQVLRRAEERLVTTARAADACALDGSDC